MLVAYYCPEPLSRKVQAALARVAEPTISPLVELELHSALALKVRTDQLDAAAAGQIAAMFQMHLTENRYRVVEIGPREHTLARTWLSSLAAPLRTLDALHLAAAFANKLNLLTSDRSLAQCAKQLNVPHTLIASLTST